MNVQQSLTRFVFRLKRKSLHLIDRCGNSIRRTFFRTALVAPTDKEYPLYPCPNFCPYPQKNGQDAHDLLYKALLRDQSCMIARFGSTEMAMLENLHLMLQQKTLPGKVIDFFLGKNSGKFFFHQGLAHNIQKLSGFFPATKALLIRWYQLCLQDMQDCDILASWWNYERLFNTQLAGICRIGLQDLNNTILNLGRPWTAALKDKKVLVIHPFQKSIEAQYARRDKLFPHNPQILPQFDLQTIKAVQSIADQESGFSDWFAALDYMKSEIDKRDFDIALLGCGAYGFNLAAHIKRRGKKAVHMGGPTQVLFGIKGKRWLEKPEFAALFNEWWTPPLR